MPPMTLRSHHREAVREARVVNEVLLASDDNGSKKKDEELESKKPT
jgi:hypothetical protein